jgi:hypothetical protein
MKPRHVAALALVGLVLLLVITIEAAGINRSLRRIERRERHRPPRPDGWLLLQPPYRIVGPYAKLFDSEAQCRAYPVPPMRIEGIVGRTFLGLPQPMPQPVYQGPLCIATNDPRLKGN